MSVDYHKEILSDGSTTIQVNFTGIADGQTDKTALGMTIFAYEATSGKAIFNVSLNYDQVKQLYDHLNSISIIRDAGETTSGKFIETTDAVAALVDRIKQLDGSAVSAVLDTMESDQKVAEILSTLNGTELENISAAHKLAKYKQELANLKELLDLEKNGDIVKEITKHANLSEYVAKQPEKIFQIWLERNPWVFGVEYAEHHDARAIAFSSEADLLMQTLDGYLDLIELKRPKLDYDLFKYDKSHKCYYPSPALAQVIGQSLFYLQKMDEFKGNRRIPLSIFRCFL